MRTILAIICLILATSLIVMSCCTEPETSSLKGTVLLVNDSGDPANDPLDHSGVTVALYELASLDTTLVRINAEYPQIGVLISQATDFDHRYQTPVATTTSAADGSFELKEIDPGSYNLVILNEGWGISYKHNLEVTKGETLDPGSMNLYPIVTFGSTALEPVTFKAEHTYVIPGDMIFLAQVEFEQEPKILASPGSIVKFYGNVICPDSENMDKAWKMMSSDGIY
ncbi:MAG: carboxypeptidase-like regulatory domain-containing protein, partial [Candidatus Cloacimonetes bacterium]|nr:carboxypeptidase-like regulatory domain-containing protein [Candidatus Cloacimonadota bacterium]